MERWPASIASGEPFEMEFRLRGSDGIFRWMLTRVVPLKDDAGRVERWFGSNIDIEDRKRSEQRSRRVASLLQEALLPSSLPAVDGLVLDALYLPAESDALVGGDWYDAVELGNGRVLLSCGDVTGHGLEAAASAARLRQTIAFAGRERPDPANVLERVNAVLVAEAAPFATAAVAVFDRATSCVTFALAGHPPPIVAQPGAGAGAVSFGGLPLGVAADATFEEQTVKLERDAAFVLYTDGLIEFDRDLLGAQRALENAVTTLASDAFVARPARFIRDRVLGLIEARDDVAILVVRPARAGTTAPAPDVPLHRTWRFHSSHALSAHVARLEVTSYLRALANDAAAVSEAELVIGELLANTVEHAPGLVEVSIDWEAAEPILRVRDSGSGMPPVRQRGLPASLDEGGRGLFLVHTLADDVTIVATPTVGTEIACRLRLRR